ncbi:MAG: trypsin-like peptidase domain-containing protein [Chloroflexota bacterium]
MNTFKVLLIAVVSSASTLLLAAGCDAVRSGALTPTAAVSSPVPAVEVAQSTVAVMGAPGSPPAAQVLAVPAAPVAAAAPAAQAAEATVRVYKDVSPSVVAVVSSAVPPDFRNEAQTRPRGIGSGIMIDDKGHILTNNHVVEDAEKLEVTLPDGSTIPAELVGRDPRFDLAVVKANIPAQLVRPVKLADSDKVEIGETAIAIGNPFGLERTITAGIVSARRPMVNEPNGQGVLVNAIQTDAAINPGNSGGPLLNARGEVIGINTMGIMPSAGPAGQNPGSQSGVNFAIPINNAKRVLPDLLAKGSFAHPFVGIASAEITQSVAQELSLPVQQGLLIQTVEPNSGGGRAGLRGGSGTQVARSRQVARGGDIVTAIDGQQMKRPEDFVAYLELNKKAGETVTLTIVRDGQQRDVQVTLGERPRQ